MEMLAKKYTNMILRLNFFFTSNYTQVNTISMGIEAIEDA